MKDVNVRVRITDDKSYVVYEKDFSCSFIDYSLCLLELSDEYPVSEYTYKVFEL